MRTSPSSPGEEDVREKPNLWQAQLLPTDENCAYADTTEKGDVCTICIPRTGTTASYGLG